MSGDVVLFEAKDGRVRLDVRLDHETVWLSLNQMAERFHVQKPAIPKHLKNICATGELTRAATVSKMESVQQEGGRRVTRSQELFNLDAVISVGYRVNSTQATPFRIWAARTLREHLVRGYTLNERRLREKGLGEIEQAVGGKSLYPTVQARGRHPVPVRQRDGDAGAAGRGERSRAEGADGPADPEPAGRRRMKPIDQERGPQGRGVGDSLRCWQKEIGQRRTPWVS